MAVSNCENNDGRVETGKNPGFMMSMLNRSFTFQKSPAFEFSMKRYERNGSVKKLYNSSFDSIASVGSTLKGRVKKLCSVLDHPPSNTLETRLSKFLYGTEDRVVVYFTSLRGVRRTFIDCSHVLMILKAFRVELDERDVSMHIAYKDELSDVLGEKCVALPQVFINGEHIGGPDFIRDLHESGELARMLKGVPIRRTMKACVQCGDMRFLPCHNCNGSRKVYDEDEDQVTRCPHCNENGLIQCQSCTFN